MFNKMIVISLLSALISTSAFAATTKTYQVTGPVLEVTDSTIVVQKGKDRWELSRGAGTKVTGDLKVGSKVTIAYQMVATDVETKGTTAATTTKAHKTTDKH